MDSAKFEAKSSRRSPYSPCYRYQQTTPPLRISNAYGPRPCEFNGLSLVESVLNLVVFIVDVVKLNCVELD